VSDETEEQKSQSKKQTDIMAKRMLEETEDERQIRAK
jgi:hypothetical protein